MTSDPTQPWAVSEITRSPPTHSSLCREISIVDFIGSSAENEKTLSDTTLGAVNYVIAVTTTFISSRRIALWDILLWLPYTEKLCGAASIARLAAVASVTQQLAMLTEGGGVSDTHLIGWRRD